MSASANLDSASPFNWSRYWWLPGLVLATLAFLPSLTFYFTSDDFTFVLFAAQHQPFYQSPQNLFYRPLPNLLWQFDYSLWGLNALGYHLTNLVLHLANVYLVGLLTLKLTANRTAALLSSLLFGLLPVHVEAVAWLSGRPDLLTTFFGLLTLLFWLTFLGAFAKKYYWFSLLAFGLAIFSKEAAAGLPFVLLAWAFFLHKPAKFHQWLNLILTLIPYALLIVIYLAVRISILGGLGGYGENGAGGGSWLNILWNVTGGLWLPLFFPLNLQILGGLIAATLALILIGLYIGLFWQRRKFSKIVGSLFALLLMYGGMLAALPIAPVSTNLAQSRLLYLPSVGFCMLLAILLTALKANKVKKVNWLSCGIAVVYIAGLAVVLYPWAVAGSLIRDTFNQLAEANLPIQSGDTVYYNNLPDNYAGAYVWRNGIDEATRLLFNSNVTGINQTSAVTVDYSAANHGNIWFANFAYNQQKLAYINGYAVGNPALPNVFANKSRQAQNWDLTSCTQSGWQLTLSQGKFSCNIGRGVESNLEGQGAIFTWQSPNLSSASSICYFQMTAYVDYDFQNPQIPAMLEVRNSTSLVQKVQFELAANGKTLTYIFPIPNCLTNSKLNLNIITTKTRDDMRWQSFIWFS